MRNWWAMFGCGLALVISGCAPVGGSTERNPFLILTETFGAPPVGDEESGAGGGTLVEGEFRGTMNVNFANNHPDADLNVLFAAWVNLNSIRSAEQQDDLLNSGYVQLTREVRLGSVFTLPPGTFVFNGAGVAGATAILLGPTDRATSLPTTQTIELITPDVLLVFSQPPVSCDSVAFFYTVDGDIPTATSVPNRGALALFEGATGGGFMKTLAQIDVYQCDPLKPGLFLKLGGGARESNEFFEGEDASWTFNAVPDANGFFANVVISP